MQIIYDLFQIFLCLILSRHITELDAVGRFYVYFGTALTHAKAHGIFAACFFHELSGKQLTNYTKYEKWQNPCHQKAYDRRSLLDLFSIKGYTCLIQTVCQIRIIYHCRLINCFFLFVRKDNGITLLFNINTSHITIFSHLDKCSVIHIFDLMFHKPRHCQ